MLAQVSDAAAAACTSADGCTVYSDFLRQYLTVFIFGCVAVGLIAGMLAVSRVLRPRSHRQGRFQAQKYINYESGVDPVGTAWMQSQVRYYVFALMFVLFDVEAVFIFPWATRVEAYDTFGLVEMFVFIAILVLGLVYAVRKKVLQWL